MYLDTVSLQDLRNIHSVEIALHPRHNLFVGVNGAGKTSVLEAVHILGFGRSFRSRHSKDLIRRSAPQLVVSASFVRDSGERCRAGVSKSLGGESQLRLNGEPVKTASVLAAEFPVVSIDNESFELITGGPSLRRAALDWTVFHVKPSFAELSRRYRRALEQRNAGLKQGQSLADLAVWSEQLEELAEQIDLARRTQLDALSVLFSQMLADIAPELAGARLEYYRGWPEGEALSSVFAERYQRDLFEKRTTRGPHAADVRFLDEQNSPIKDVFSRGQLKVAVVAFKCAQAKLYNEQSNKNCTLLLDDLAAELDKEKHKRVIQLFDKMGCQTLQTYTDTLDIEAVALHQDDCRMFHVKQGEVTTFNTNSELSSL